MNNLELTQTMSSSLHASIVGKQRSSWGTRTSVLNLFAGVKYLSILLAKVEVRDIRTASVAVS